jgi:hypothetical protein
MGDDASDDISGSHFSAQTPRSSATTPHRRTLKGAVTSGKKLMSSASARASPYKRATAAALKDRTARARSDSVQRKPGDEWVNLEGDRCRMDEDGEVRKLTEVREMRRKYKVSYQVMDTMHNETVS